MSRRTRSPGPAASGLPSNTSKRSRWKRLAPTGAATDYGTLAADHVTLSDDSIQTTITWLEDVSWVVHKNPSTMALWWIDTGLQWKDAAAIVVTQVMSTIPSHALKPLWGVIIGTGTDAGAGGWHGGTSTIYGPTTDHGFSSKINLNNTSFSAPGSEFTTLKTWFDISKVSSAAHRLMNVTAWGYDPSGEVFASSTQVNTAFDAGRLASPTDTLYIGLCVGNQASTAPTDDVTAVGKFYYTINTAGDQS